jgi:hypothetical protein
MPDHDDDQPRGLNSAQREVEGALRSLAPANASVDPVAAAFDAGRHSTRGQVRMWRSAAAVLLLIGAGSWLVPTGRRGAEVTPPVSPGSSSFVIHTRPQRTVPTQPLADESLLMLEQVVRDKGMDGLPAPPRLPADRPVIRAGDSMF